MTRQTARTRILIAGAGFGGLCTALRLKMQGDEDFVVWEKAEGPGGVWRHNDYPGAACDIASSLYSFSFEPNYDWPRSHGSHDEIRDYMNFCIDKYGVRSHLRFGTEIAEARFDERANIWRVASTGGEVIEADIFISASGLFNLPQIPKIEGQDNFAGPHFHSARWDHSFNARGKTIAVIGNGCSAAQFVPELVETAAQVKLFMRSPCHVVPKTERVYTPEERQLYQDYPILRAVERARLYGEQIERALGQIDKGLRDQGTQMALGYMASQITDPDKREKLLPDFPLGGKRPIGSDTFLKALDRSNVEIVTAPIARISADAVHTGDGVAHRVDAIVYGTGFATSQYLAPMRIFGRDGRELHDVWRDGAEAYAGVNVAGFPNFFMVYGPNTNVQGSVLAVIEPQVDYILKCLEAYKTGARTIEIKPEVQQAFNAQLQADLGGTIFGMHTAHNYYSAANGRIVTQWPGPLTGYVKLISDVDWTNYSVAS